MIWRMRLSHQDLQAVWLTAQLALTTTLLLLGMATPLAWWLAHSRSRFAAMTGALVTLPLVLPPTVIGFYLLLAFGPQGWGGQITQAMGWGLLPFSFGGLVLASAIYSLPFAVQPIRHAFESVGLMPMEVAASLRARPFDAFWHVAVPMARPGFITAAVLTFAHTVGEFGVVLMIGGNIPAHTRVVATQIYGHVEALEYSQAHGLAAALLAFSFLVMLALSLLQRRMPRLFA